MKEIALAEFNREELLQNWLAVFQNFKVSKIALALAYAKLEKNYSSDKRYYHTFNHIVAVLNISQKLCKAYELNQEESTIVELAVWFHDVVYDTHAQDNEERSAEFAEKMLKKFKLPQAMIERVETLVLATKKHQLTEEKDLACQIFLDADLAILGAKPELYALYTRAIRREYEWVALNDYRAERSRVLENFLLRPRLYFTDTMFVHFERQARENLQQEIRSYQDLT